MLLGDVNIFQATVFGKISVFHGHLNETICVMVERRNGHLATLPITYSNVGNSL